MLGLMLVLIDFDLTVAANFFSENGQFPFEMNKNSFAYCNVYALAHISVPLLVLITFRSTLR